MAPDPRSAETTSPAGHGPRELTATRRLLTCGVVAGPVLLAVLLGQALWRPGFELGVHALSLLSRGEHGWTQIAAFVLTGLLVGAAGAGVRRAAPGTSGALAGWLVTAMGAGLVLAGAFVVDPGTGFPPGGPPPALELSWHGALHDVGTALALNAGVAAALVLAWYAARAGARAASAGSLLAAVAVAALAWWGGPGVPLRVTVAVTVLAAWLTAACLVLRRRLCTEGAGRGGPVGGSA
ncbi:DUF998 domain-containing protein [Georgenia sp. TF02-10]|uniref:DUF998 domain-containing protein n=1 Tax=Georgenia sp. TF02-10 TaxID=2917725 RepID=UPI001FA6F7FA|nr:DUF998 domain-containing protein [Georgenia sp. TF02-10]UNX55077.1 DUF998 domain-containing protein [Georgenia sp. TF02-10]